MRSQMSRSVVECGCPAAFQQTLGMTDIFTRTHWRMALLVLVPTT